MQTRICRWLSVPLALLAVGLAGCGDKTGPAGKVDGHVTLDGQPVPEGTVVMFQEGPEPFSGITGADGKFTTAKPVKVGSYTVAVQQVEKDEMSPGDRKKAAAAGKSIVFQSVIPEKYMTGATSGVKFDVKEGNDNKFELDMTKQGGSGPAPSTGGTKGGKY